MNDRLKQLAYELHIELKCLENQLDGDIEQRNAADPHNMDADNKRLTALCHDVDYNELTYTIKKKPV